MKKKEIRDMLYVLLQDLQEVGIAIGSEEHDKFISNKKRDQFGEVEQKLDDFINNF